MRHRTMTLKCPALLLAMLLTAAAALAGTETATRTYDIGALSITAMEEDGIPYSKVELEGLYSSQEVGTPELPVEYIRFVVPTSSKDFSVTAAAIGSTVTHRLPSRIWPVQHPIPTNGLYVPEFASPVETAYAQGSKVRAEVVDDGFIDGCNHIVTVAVYPVSYSDADLTLKIATNVEVTLSYTLCSIAALETKPIFPPVASPYLKMEDLVVNPVSVASHSPSRTVSIDTIPRYYYIITPRNLEPSFRHLAVWKRQKGYRVTVKCIEDIYATPRYAIGKTCVFTNGATEEIVDSAASLRAYLKDEYIAKGTYFCLLAGDYRTPMPIRRVRCDYDTRHGYDYEFNPGGHFYVPTDNYFSDFTTKWTLTKKERETVYADDERYVGYSPDVTIGRLLCSQPKEVENYLRKLIIYESNPGRGDASYLQNHVYFEQDQWGVNEKGDSICTGMLGEANIVRKKFDPFPLSTKVISDSCHYYLSQPQINCHEFNPHTGTAIINAISIAGFSSWHGHGSPTVIGTCWAHFIIPITSYTDDQVNRQRRFWDQNIGLDMMCNIDKPSVAYSISCDISPFDMFCNSDGNGNTGHIFDIPYNFGSAFTVAGDFGGPAILCNTRHGWVTYSARMESYFGDFLLKQPKIGIAEALSKDIYPDYHLRATHHLIGDPEFEMWTVLPKKFENISFNIVEDGVELHGKDLYGANIVTYFGDDGSTWQECPSSYFVLNKARLKNDFAVSIWKTGYMPIIKLYSFEGTMKNVTKEYIVHTASLGNPLGEESNDATIMTKMGSGSRYTVYASESITAYKNFIIEDGAEVILDCEKTVELSCTVKAGGKLTVRGKDVKMTSGFNVEKGGVFNMEMK